MPTFLRFLALLLLLVAATGSPLLAADSPEGPRQAAQRFYDQYVKVKDTIRWVAHSSAVTPKLKKAFLATMKDPNTEVDPIVEGQDVPSSGFKASEPVVKGATATLTMKSSDSGFPQTIHVRLIFDGKAWLIDGVNKLNAK